MTFDRVAARKRCEAALIPPATNDERDVARVGIAALDELDAVHAELARLREALEFYADPDLWSPDGQGGAVARQALADPGVSDGE